MTNTPDKFWFHVDKTGYCWEWTLSTMPNGYAQYRLNNKKYLCHRLFIEFSRALLGAISHE